MDRRSFLATGGVTLGAAAIAGCLGDDSDADAGDIDADADDLPSESMQIVHGYPEDPMFHGHQAAITVQDYMDRRTDGQFEVEIVPGGAAGDDTEMLEQVQSGAVEATSSAAEGHLTPFYANMNVVGLPFFFEDVEVANFVFDGPYGDRLRDDFRDQTGMRMLGFYDNGGFRHFTTSETRVTEPGDMEGLTVRTMNMDAHQEMVRQLGAEPVSIEGTEIYSALDQGVADAQENPVPIIQVLSFYEVQEYLMLDGHVHSMLHLICNDEWYDDLHPAYQQLVAEAGYLGAINARKVNRLMRERGRPYLRERMTVVEEDEIDVDAFRERTQEPVEEFVRDAVDDEMWVDDLYDARDRAMEHLGY